MRSSWQLFLSALASSTLFGNEQIASARRLRSRGSDVIRRRANYDVVSVEMPGLQNLSPYVCPNNDVNVKRQNIIPTNATITIPKSQLRPLLQKLRAMEKQCVDLIDKMLLEEGLAAGNSSDIANSTATNPHLQVSQTSSTAQASLSSAVNNALRIRDPTSYTTIPTIRRRGMSIATLVVNTTVCAAEADATATSYTTITSTTVVALATTTVDSQGGIDAAALLQSPTVLSAASAVTTDPVPSPSDLAEKDYVFNAHSSKNIAVYFGQTPVTGGTTLAAQCADPNIDIVILAFVISTSDAGQYPQVNFGAACGGQTPEMIEQAPGLLSCPELASYINICQTSFGKKVLLSVGGATGGITFSSPTQASNFADVLWQLFGPTGNIDPALRPFGTVEIDGFDIDNENNMPANYDTLASTLRTHHDSETSKKYYLSSAPQCPFPDASNPMGLLLLCDFVFVQFYNNPPCEIGSAGFAASVSTWSTALSKSMLTTKPRLYVGAPAFPAAGASAYAHIGGAEGMQRVVSGVGAMGLDNFGGVMFWDGPEGMLNVEDGKDIFAWAKAGLTV